LADLIKSTKSDCFYNDEVINSTFSIIHIHWNEHAEEKKAMQEMRVGEVSMEQWDVSAVLE